MLRNRKRLLRKIPASELEAVAGDDWTKVWTKLEIEPRLTGRLLIGEFFVGGRPAQPLVAQLGYARRADVAEALGVTLGLPGDHALEFLSCTRELADVLADMELRLMLSGEDVDDELGQ